MLISFASVFSDCPLELLQAQSGDFDGFAGVCANQDSISLQLPLSLKGSFIEGEWDILSGGGASINEITLNRGECYFIHFHSEVGFYSEIEIYTPLYYKIDNRMYECKFLSYVAVKE